MAPPPPPPEHHRSWAPAPSRALRAPSRALRAPGRWSCAATRPDGSSRHRRRRPQCTWSSGIEELDAHNEHRALGHPTWGKNCPMGLRDARVLIGAVKPSYSKLEATEESQGFDLVFKKSSKNCQCFPVSVSFGLLSRGDQKLSRQSLGWNSEHL